MAVETLRPTSVVLSIIRGAANEYVFTVLGPNGLPKNMSAYAAIPPIIKFKNKTLELGGIVGVNNVDQNLNTAIAQALNADNSVGICEWMNGGVGGQIHVRIPTVPFADGTQGSRTASNLPAWKSGVFDIQVKSIEDLTPFGGPAGISNVQRAITGTWSIDEEVTNI